MEDGVSQFSVNASRCTACDLPRECCSRTFYCKVCEQERQTCAYMPGGIDGASDECAMCQETRLFGPAFVDRWHKKKRPDLA